MALTRGRLCGGWVYFPSGPAGTLYLQVRRGLNQILPSNPDGAYNLDDIRVNFYLDVVLSQPPYEVSILTWNTSTSYDHTLTLALFLDPFLESKESGSWLGRIFSSKK